MSASAQPASRRTQFTTERPYPGFGTTQDISRLSKELELPQTLVETVMTSRGRGLKRGAAETTEAPAVDTGLWSDFLVEEGVQEREEKKTKTDNNNSTTDYLPLPAPPTREQGVLVQCGTLDSQRVGRTKLTTQDHDVLYHCWVPTCLSSIIKVTQVLTSASASHTLAIAEDGTLYGWGRNEHGQLGLEAENIAQPTIIRLPPVATGACGGRHSVVVLREAKKSLLWAAGDNKAGQCGTKSHKEGFKPCALPDSVTNVLSIAAGLDFSVLLDGEGRLFSTGSSEFGQLGNGETGEYFMQANKLAFANCATFTERIFTQATAQGPVQEGVRFAQVACGKHHTVALERGTAAGPRRVYTWGCGNYGVLGHGLQADAYYPLQVPLPAHVLKTSDDDSQVGAGAICSTLQTSSGLYYWGKHGRAVEATMRPTVMELPAAIHTAGGGQTMVVATTESDVYAWGVGSHGELGLGTAQKSSSQPVAVEGWKGAEILALAAANGHTVAIVKDASKLPMVEGVDELEKKNARMAK